MSDRRKRFETLVEAYLPDLYRYGIWLCRERPLAEDLVQETMLRAWRALDSLKDEKSAKYWLLTILRREHARHYRRQRADTVDVDDMPLEDKATLGTGTSAEVDEIRRAMFRLPEDYREPLVLQILMGYSTREIAETLEIRQGAVLTRLHRARRKLRELMDRPGWQTAGGVK